MKKDIYIITNDINDKVYIGQSVNAHNRFIQHKSEARLKSNNMLIHKAMNKYGVEHFSYAILEEQIDNYDERECYWIKQYNSVQPNGYNICIGGQGTGASIFNISSKIKDIETLMNVYDLIKNTNITFENLAKQFNISETQISGINTGKYYYNNEFIYPLRPKKYNDEKVKQVTYALKYELDKSLITIAKEYNIDYSQLSELNTGKIYYRDYINYPIRQSKEYIMQLILPDIIKDLQENIMSQKDIAKKYNISQMTVTNINLGTRWHNEQYIYPIRINIQNSKTKVISPDLLNIIMQELKTSNLSMNAIGHKYDISPRIIQGINIGSIKKYRLDNILYPIRKK